MLGRYLATGQNRSDRSKVWVGQYKLTKWSTQTSNKNGQVWSRREHPGEPNKMLMTGRGQRSWYTNRNQKQATFYLAMQGKKNEDNLRYPVKKNNMLQTCWLDLVRFPKFSQKKWGNGETRTGQVGGWVGGCNVFVQSCNLKCLTVSFWISC